MFKTVLAIWASTATAIGIALYYTHDIRCLWFLLIPACVSIGDVDNEESPQAIDYYCFKCDTCMKDGRTLDEFIEDNKE